MKCYIALNLVYLNSINPLPGKILEGWIQIGVNCVRFRNFNHHEIEKDVVLFNVTRISLVSCIM